MTDAPEQTQAKCDRCMKPVVRFEDPESEAAWDNDGVAHDCQACSSVICSACALSYQIRDEHNPGWQCPECFQDNLLDV